MFLQALAKFLNKRVWKARQKARYTLQSTTINLQHTPWRIPTIQVDYFVEVSIRNKREFRANRKRARRCNRGLLLHYATGIQVGKAQEKGWSGSQKTCLKHTAWPSRIWGRIVASVEKSGPPDQYLLVRGLFYGCGPSPRREHLEKIPVKQQEDLPNAEKRNRLY